MHCGGDISLLRIMTLIGSSTLNLRRQNLSTSLFFHVVLERAIWAFNLLKIHLNSVSRDKKISRRFQSTRNGGQCPHFNILYIQKKIEKLKIFTRKYPLENLSKTKYVSIAEIRAKVRHDSLCIVLLNFLKITQRVRDMAFGWRKEIKD